MSAARPKRPSARKKTSTQTTLAERPGPSMSSESYFLNCNVQFGNRNTMTFNEVQKCIEEPSELNRCGISQNEFGVFLIKTVLNSSPNLSMPLEELKSTLNDVIFDFKRGKTTSFKQICGSPLIRFIEKYNESFNKFNKKGVLTIKLRTPKQKDTHEKQASAIVDDDVIGSHFDDFVEAESYSHEPETSDTESDYKTSEESEFPDRQKSIPQSETTGWSTVISRKQKRKRKGKHLEETATNSSDVGQKPVSFCNLSEANGIDLCTFISLLHKQDGSDVKFCESDTPYIACPLSFMLDLVSMWNTPQRIKSYIILGVRPNTVLPHQLVGLATAKTVSFYESLFDRDIFTMSPTFKYHCISYESKLFGIIEVQSSFGHCVPITCKVDMDVGNIKLQEGQLWYRPKSENVVCKPSDLTIASIYQWFSAKVSSTEETEKSSQRKPKPTKNDGTSRSTGSEIRRDVTEQNLESDDGRCAVGKTFKHFWHAVNCFQKCHFVLISGDVSNRTKHLEAFSRVPWIAVYDFDKDSGSKGLLNATQDFIERKRSLRICTWMDEAKPISETGTFWCFMRGRQGLAESRTNEKDGAIEDSISWHKTVKKCLSKHVQQLVSFEEEYTVITLVVIWPENEQLISIIQKFIGILADKLDVTPNLVLCMTQHPRSDSGQARFKTLCADFEKNVKICNIDLESLCQGIISHVKNDNTESTPLALPTADGCANPDITEQDATWLREDIDVLYLSNHLASGSQNIDLEAEINKFFRGGTLPWPAWYELGSNGVGIERSVMKQVNDQIKVFTTETYKSGVITIYHSPGSGGSTLGQRILMSNKDRYPCIQLKKKIPSMDDFIGRILFLHNKTHLPVLILLDGFEESFVKQLAKCLKKVNSVILHVKRYLYKVRERDKVPGKCFLDGIVSKPEANTLSVSFGERCDNESKKSALNRLNQDVQNGKTHYLYEFGMTAYLHEFKGVNAYVKGYLRLQDNPSKDLLPWQKILGYLALVYFYGHTSVPCQFFTALLNKPPNYCVTIEDFKHPVCGFIVSDETEGRKKHIRMCHYVVAKEILEQILTRRKHFSSQGDETLSIAAKRNLKTFCVEFIEYCSKKKTKSSATCTPVTYILTKTFIFRDDKDMGEEEQSRKKPVLSRAMIDIPSDSPLFTERLQVLEKLTQCFPEDPNFRAHLGRFFAYCRPDEDDKAEKCFKQAIQLCEEKTKGKDEEEIDDRMKLSLMHIYHMYGIIKHRQVTRFTGRSPKEVPERPTGSDEFNERLSELVDLAETACTFFEKSRDITPPSHDVFLYAYTKEIEVRLQICEFINRRFRNEDKTLFDFISTTTDHSAVQFVRSNIAMVENLIMECYSDFENMDDPAALQRVIQWYNSLFKQHALRYDEIAGEDEISSRRLKIAARKLSFGNKNKFTFLENIFEENAVREIVHLYEQNFQDCEDGGLIGKSSRRILDLEYREWIFAIRHEFFKPVYTIEQVLLFVQTWNYLLNSPMSKFYLFVMKSLLGFGTDNTNGKTPLLQEAKALQEDLAKTSRCVVRSDYPREWLGRSEKGIKRLLPGNRFNTRVCDDRIVSGNRQICIGTIKHPNTKKLSGTIEYDLGMESVRVFFIPHLVVPRLVGSRFAGRRVEFNLAFSFEHGYKAYNIKLLHQYGCSNCSCRLEIKSDLQEMVCDCGTLVHKDDMNEDEEFLDSPKPS